MPDIRITCHYLRGTEVPYVVAHIPVQFGIDPQTLIEELMEDYMPDPEEVFYEFISPPTRVYSGKTTLIRTDAFIDLSFKVVNGIDTK